MNRWRTVVAVVAGVAMGPSVAFADDDDWSFELNLRLGPTLAAAPDAERELRSGAGLEVTMGPEFVSSGHWGLGVAFGGNFDLDGEEAGISRFVTDFYGLHRFELGEADWLALRAGPSLWWADAGMTPECGMECDEATNLRRDALDEYDTTVVGGMLSLSFNRAAGPFMVGADLRGRVGYAAADDVAVVRANVTLALTLSMRLPPKSDYSDD